MTPTPPHLLHLHSGNLYGGVERFLVTLARLERASASPVMHHTFALCFEGRLADELQGMGARVWMLGACRMSRPWTVWRARGRVAAVANQGEAHAVIVHGAWSQALLLPAAARLRGARLRYYHEAAPDHWLERWARRTRVQGHIANSDFTAERIAPPGEGERAWTIRCPTELPPPQDAEARERIRAALAVPPGRLVILQVSRMQRWKGQALLLGALARLPAEPAWECWQVGGAQQPAEAAYLASLQAQVASLGLQDRVRFLGERNDVPALLAGADVLCQPNIDPKPPGLGLTMVEAMAVGMPVVATNLGGEQEMLGDECGLRVAPDAVSLAGALELLLRDGALRRRLGQPGPARARRLCDPEARVKELAEAVRSVAGTKTLLTT